MAGKCFHKHLPRAAYSDGSQKCYKAANMLNSPPVAATSHGAIWSLLIWSWGQHLCACWLPVLCAGIWDIPICSPVSPDFNSIWEQRIPKERKGFHFQHRRLFCSLFKGWYEAARFQQGCGASRRSFLASAADHLRINDATCMLFMQRWDLAIQKPSDWCTLTFVHTFSRVFCLVTDCNCDNVSFVGRSRIISTSDKPIF